MKRGYIERLDAFYIAVSGEKLKKCLNCPLLSVRDAKRCKHCANGFNYRIKPKRKKLIPTKLPLISHHIGVFDSWQSESNKAQSVLDNYRPVEKKKTMLQKIREFLSKLLPVNWGEK